MLLLLYNLCHVYGNYQLCIFKILGWKKRPVFNKMFSFIKRFSALYSFWGSRSFLNHKSYLKLFNNLHIRAK